MCARVVFLFFSSGIFKHVSLILSTGNFKKVNAKLQWRNKKGPERERGPIPLLLENHLQFTEQLQP